MFYIILFSIGSCALGYVVCHLRYKSKFLGLSAKSNDEKAQNKMLAAIHSCSIALDIADICSAYKYKAHDAAPLLLALCQQGRLIKQNGRFFVAGDEDNLDKAPKALAAKDAPSGPLKEGPTCEYNFLVEPENSDEEEGNGKYVLHRDRRQAELYRKFLNNNEVNEREFKEAIDIRKKRLQRLKIKTSKKETQKQIEETLEVSQAIENEFKVEQGEYVDPPVMVLAQFSHHFGDTNKEA